MSANKLTGAGFGLPASDVRGSSMKLAGNLRIESQGMRK